MISLSSCLSTHMFRIGSGEKRQRERPNYEVMAKGKAKVPRIANDVNDKSGNELSVKL